MKADLLLTDPPYNVDYTEKEKFLLDYRPNARVKKGDKTGIKNDKKNDEDFRNFLIAAFKVADVAMKAGAAFYIWHADYEGFNFRTACVDTGWKVRQCLIWYKNHFVLGRQDYQWMHEPCLYGWKEGAAHYFIDDHTQTTVIEDKPDLNKMSKQELKALCKQLLAPKAETTVLEEDKPAVSADHPTMKPVKLFARQIRNSTKAGDVVLDIFGGSGTTLIACEQLGRQCRTMELDPKYCDVIIKRWKALTGGKAVRL